MKPMLINVRGTNGSGKTTLLRSLTKVKAVVRVHDVADHKPIPVTTAEHPLGQGLIAIIGDYAKPGCAGLDRIRTQDAAKDIIRLASNIENVRAVLFEGVLVSTIYEPWLKFSRENGGMVWAFLDTPLDVCLQRIQVRNGGKPVKEDQVKSKHMTIARIRDKARAAGEQVLDLPYQHAKEALLGRLCWG